jgi:phosphatidylglycerol:prolipoprotein diacylglycerol transferase
MHPVFFHIGDTAIHGYGVMIMLGALAGLTYMTYVSKKELNIEPDKIQTLAIYIIIAAFVGGKLFFYFEKPSYYFNPPSRMFENFRQGFVFYGSLLFAIPVAVWYFRKEKWPLWPVMDRLAITALIVHAFGRMGCFMAGCCYGQPTDAAWGVTFSDPKSEAEPLNTALHPTQLYEISYLLIILGILFMLKRHKRFEGQLFFIYLILYSIGRSINEIFRGDVRRGFVIEDILSHSQFISIIIISATVWAYMKFNKKAKLRARAKSK